MVCGNFVLAHGVHGHVRNACTLFDYVELYIRHCVPSISCFHTSPQRETPHPILLYSANAHPFRPAFVPPRKLHLLPT